MAVVRIVLSGLAAKGIACSGRGSGSLDRSEGHAKENSVAFWESYEQWRTA